MQEKLFDDHLNVYDLGRDGKVFQIPLREFPGLLGYAYFVWYDGYRVLIDTGSGFGESNQDLERGFQSISDYLGKEITFKHITHILLTHGHVDHFGGLNYIRSNSNASVGIHELDRRIITNYEERLTIIANRLADFFIEAGVGNEQREELIRLYKTTKSLYASERVDFTYESIDMRLGPFSFLHVPGHSAGHVVIRVEDVLFSGDHVLDETSPHQAPEQITLSTGLDHYLQSLDKLRPMARELRITFGGHEHPIYDLEKRIDVIRGHHMHRLQRVLDLMNEPTTIAQVSNKLFGQILGYHQLLALEETGAHVEYLYNRGLLKISNLADIDGHNGLNHNPIEYQCIECIITDSKNLGNF